MSKLRAYTSYPTGKTILLPSELSGCYLEHDLALGVIVNALETNNRIDFIRMIENQVKQINSEVWSSEFRDDVRNWIDSIFFVNDFFEKLYPFSNR
jgi:hypothetical protein